MSRSPSNLTSELAVRFNVAVAAFQAGDVGAAASHASAVLEQAPRFPEAWRMLAACFLRIGNPEAIEHAEQAVSLAPSSVEAAIVLAEAYLLFGSQEAALERIQPHVGKDARAAHIAARALAALGRMADACDLLRDPALAASVPCGLLLGDLLTDLGQYDEAREQFTKVSQMKAPPAAFLGMARTFRQEGALDRAVETLNEACLTHGRLPAFIANLAALKRDQGARGEAEDLAKIVAPRSDEWGGKAQSVLGALAADRDDTDGVEAHYRRALELTPFDSEASLGLAVQLLLRGDPEGYKLYETRGGRGGARGLADLGALASNHVAVVGEQGIGDQLLYGTLIGALNQHVQRVSIAVERRLVGLFQRAWPDTQVFGLGDPLPSDAIAVPMGDLPGILGLAPQPYRTPDVMLTAPQSAIDAIRHRYTEAHGGRLTVGVAWHSGNPDMGAFRSISAEEMANLIPDGFVPVSLQHNVSKADIDAFEWAGRPLFVDPEINQSTDMERFFAQVQAVDAVLTIDNTTAHVAGATGRDHAHVLLPLGGGLTWFWGREGEVDPWYGSLALHRQETCGEWTPAFRSASNALQGLKMIRG